MYYSLLIRDCFEVVFYSCIIYVFCLWLKEDNSKNILVYFLAYCSLMIISWISEMPTLTSFLFSYATIAIIVLIVIHEKTLQRNLLSIYKPVTRINPTDEGIDALISGMLVAINNNKKCSILFENKQALDYMVQAPYLIDAKLGKDILILLITSSLYDEEKMIWATSSGYIRAINVIWKEEASSLLYTTDNDAIIFSLEQKTRTFTIIAQGIKTVNIPMITIKNLIKEHLFPHKATPPKGYRNEKIFSQKTTF